MVDDLCSEFAGRVLRAQIEEVMNDSSARVARDGHRPRLRPVDGVPIHARATERDHASRPGTRPPGSWDVVFVSLSGGGRGQIAAANRDGTLRRSGIRPLSRHRSTTADRPAGANRDRGIGPRSRSRVREAGHRRGPARRRRDRDDGPQRRRRRHPTGSADTRTGASAIRSELQPTRCATCATTSSIESERYSTTSVCHIPTRRRKPRHHLAAARPAATTTGRQHAFAALDTRHQYVGEVTASRAAARFAFHVEPCAHAQDRSEVATVSRAFKMELLAHVSSLPRSAKASGWRPSSLARAGAGGSRGARAFAFLDCSRRGDQGTK